MTTVVDQTQVQFFQRQINEAKDSLKQCDEEGEELGRMEREIKAAYQACKKKHVRSSPLTIAFS